MSIKDKMRTKKYMSYIESSISFQRSMESEILWYLRKEKVLDLDILKMLSPIKKNFLEMLWGFYKCIRNSDFLIYL